MTHIKILMAEEERRNSQSDHDLLIRLDTKMDRAGIDIASINSQIANLSNAIDNKIAVAVSGKADLDEFNNFKAASIKSHDDHEQRIRRFEKYAWSAIGALAVIQIALAVFK